MNILQKLYRSTAKRLDNIKIFSRPMFIDFSHKNYRCISNDIFYSIKNIMEAYDNKPCILGRYYNEYLSSYLIGNKLISHVGLYTGRTINKIPDAVIHSVGNGIIVESLLKFLSCDKFYIMMPNESITKDDLLNITYKAESYVGKDYDFFFKSDDDNFYCSELIFELFKDYSLDFDFKLKPISNIFGTKEIIKPIDILNSSINSNTKLDLIYSFPELINK